MSETCNTIPEPVNKRHVKKGKRTNGKKKLRSRETRLIRLRLQLARWRNWEEIADAVCMADELFGRETWPKSVCFNIGDVVGLFCTQMDRFADFT